jgi:anthranilate phosphoribosyltransferase
VSDPLVTALNRLAARLPLSAEEVAAAFDLLMEGRGTPAQASGFLLGLRARGETAEEVAGAATAVRRAMVPVQHPLPLSGRLVDTCGTGGGRVTTINISTAAAFLAAAAGVPVAKHGNRSHTSRSGSADVLEALGVPVGLPPAAAAESLARTGLVFLFAPAHHPAMKQLAPIRRELGVPTILNLVGPLANPAGVRRQVVGVAEADRGPVMAEALRLLGTIHALVVHAEVGMDEISPVGVTRLWEVQGTAVREGSLDPAALGLGCNSLAGLEGGDPAENAARIQVLFDDRAPPALRAAVLLNAAAAIYVSEGGGDWVAAAGRAEEALRSGAARRKLEELCRPLSTSG